MHQFPISQFSAGRFTARPLQVVILCGISALLFAGCSGGANDPWSANRPKRVPSEGTVQYKGLPVAEATVLFVPQGHQHPAVGVTDATGRFRLQTFETDDGAVPGEFKVTVVKLSAPTGQSGDGDDSTASSTPQKSLIPAKYNSATSSKLTASVAETGKNEFSFKLED